jgi:putative copper export protein
MFWDPSSPSEAPLYILVRWLSFSAIVLAIGALLFPRLVGSALRSVVTEQTAQEVEKAVRTVTVGAGVAVLIAATLRLVMQRAMLNAAFAPDVVPWRDVVSGTFGTGLWLQIGGAAMTIVAASQANYRRGVLAILAAGMLAFAPGLSGHAASATPMALSLMADAIHMLTAGAWVGMLALLTFVATPMVRAHEPDKGAEATRAMVGAFSPVALGSVGLLVASGVYAGWRLVGSFEALFNTRYGAALLVKVALLIGMLTLGGINWRWLGPASGSPAGMVRLRRAAMGELLFAVAVLLVTAALVGRPSPTE